MEKITLYLGSIEIGKVKKSGVIAKITIDKGKSFYNVHIQRKIINRILDGDCVEGFLHGQLIEKHHTLDNKFIFIPD